MTKSKIFEHPLTSLIITVYSPALNPLIESANKPSTPVGLGAQKYVISSKEPL